MRARSARRLSVLPARTQLSSVERSSGVKVRAVGYLLMPHHDIERFSLQLSTRSLFGVAPPMHGLDVFRMVISPGSSHSLRVSVVRHDVAAVGKFMVTNGALPVLLDEIGRAHV